MLDDHISQDITVLEAITNHDTQDSKVKTIWTAERRIKQAYKQEAFLKIFQCELQCGFSCPSSKYIIFVFMKDIKSQKIMNECYNRVERPEYKECT